MRDFDKYYTTQAKNDNKLRMNTPRQEEKEELMGIWDRTEYMNKVNWPEKKLKNRYKIEMFFCIRMRMRMRRTDLCGVVVSPRELKRDNKVIKADIRWSEESVACGESDLTEELLKKNL